MIEETAPDSACRNPDKAESSDSSIHSDQGITFTRHEDCIPDRSPTSPDPQSQGEEPSEEHLLGHSGSDGFRPDHLGQGPFYPLSAQSFVAVGQENPCDDLPVVFSLPNHEDDSSKVYCCHICNFKTAFKNSLVNHQAVHSDARPWVCEICDYAAKRKQDLKKHLQTIHGMIVDSLSLKLGNNPLTCVSSTTLSSPVDTKPVLVTSAVSNDRGSSAVQRYAGSHVMNSAGQMTQPQSITTFRQPLASSVMVSPTSRSAVAMGKTREDPFQFCQVQNDEKTANMFLHNSSSDTCLNNLKLEFRKELDSSHSSCSDNLLLQKLHGHKDEQFTHGCSENAIVRSCSQTESKDSINLPSLSKMMTLPSRDRRTSSVTDEYVSVNTSALGSPKCSDSNSSEGIVRSEALSTHVTVSPPSGAAELIHRRKRLSVNSSDQAAVKVPRFQSRTSDLERCTQVTSQSDRSVNSEFISSTVAHSRALETKKSFHCGHCDILFFESAMYLMHAGLHDGSNPWKCSVCGRTFFEKYSFTSHFINQH